MGIDDAKIIDLPRIQDPRGNLTFVEGGNHIPFDIARTYYVYDVPGGESRGGHAHKECHEFLIAVSGSFDVVVSDGDREERFFLNRSYYGLHIPTMLWRELENFSTGSVCLVLASTRFEESDSYRERDDFLAAVR
jgi:dTDP-4-dehydrorhamnose 3,5-epimerase-like enzyme